MAFNLSRRQFVAGSTGLMAGLLAGCSTSPGQSGQPSDQPSNQPSMTEVDGTAAPELQPDASKADLSGGPQWKPTDLTGVTLTMWGLNYKPHIERYGLLIKRFTDATGAKVKLQPQDDPQRQMLTALAGGNPPDVVCLMGIRSDQLVSQGGLLSLTDVVYQELGIDTGKWWTPDAIGAYTWGDKHYGVPLEANTHASVTCRLDLLEAAGDEASSLWPGTEPKSACQRRVFTLRTSTSSSSWRKRSSRSRVISSRSRVIRSRSGVRTDRAGRPRTSTPTCTSWTPSGGTRRAVSST